MPVRRGHRYRLCVAAVLGTVPPAETAQPSVVLGSPDITPQPSQPDASASPSAEPSASPQGTTIVRAYNKLYWRRIFEIAETVTTTERANA